MRAWFMLPAPTIYDAQGRAMGHRHTPPSRDSLRQLKDLVPRLQQLPIKHVVYSDLDGQSGSLIARKLNIRGEEWRSLRRLNVGYLHGQSPAKVTEVWDSLQSPEVPIKGGDSHASYGKRIAATRSRVAKLNDVLVMAGEREIQSILGVQVKLEWFHVYEAEVTDGSEAEADVAAPAHA